MDLDFSFFLIPLSFLVFLASIFLVTTRSKPGSNSLPPGPRKLPVIGNLHLFATSLAPHRVLADLALKYGPLVHLRLGEVSTIVVSSPEAAKQVLKTHDITFANRPSLFSGEIILYNSTDIAFSPYGEYWRQLRKICTLELLSARRVQSFRPLREKEFSDMCRWIASKQGSVISLSERVEVTMCNTFMRASIGKETGNQGVLISAIKEAVTLGAGFSAADVYPSIKILRQIGGMKGKLERVHKVIDGILQDIINDHKRATGESKQQEADLVDVLLKFNDVGDELFLTIENIKAVILDVFLAGIETSATTIDWTFAEMLRHPRVLHKAQDEVRQVFKEKGFVDEPDLDKLKYLKLVIKESLRMHPPIPLLIPRENYETSEINGYKVAANTRVIVNAWAIGRDPRNWSDPDTFAPERFVDVAVDYKGNNFEYIPFGAGRRICPGMSFGLAHVELPLAMLLYHFDWVSTGNVDMTESFGATAARKNPLHLIPAVVNPLPRS